MNYRAFLGAWGLLAALAFFAFLAYLGVGPWSTWPLELP